MSSLLLRYFASKSAVRVAITGGSSPVAYSLIFRIASGSFLGPDQPIFLQIHDSAERQSEARGVAMELDDCAFRLVKGVIVTDGLGEAVRDADYTFITEIKPKSPSMEKSELLKLNAEFFLRIGASLNTTARKSVRVLVIGNSANTNCLLTLHAAKDLNKYQFTAMARLSHNRAVSLLAAKTNVHVTDVKKMAVWGNHSKTMFPDITHATVQGTAAGLLVQKQWVTDEFIPIVQSRRKMASASAVATAAVDQMRDWTFGCSDWVSMGLLSDVCKDPYGVPKGLVFSYPAVCNGGLYHEVQGLAQDKDTHERFKVTIAELEKERSIIEHFLK